jgi:hypothetical protein
MANCLDKLTSDMLFDCADRSKKGLDAGKVVFINREDVDWVNTTIVDGKITNLQLLSGKSGFNGEFYKQLASGTATYVPSTDDVDGYTQSFLCRLQSSSDASSTQAAELAGGKFLVVMETTYKGTSNLDAFKVLGYEVGLTLTELEWNTTENSGALVYTCATEEGAFESRPYNILLMTDYATTKASFDTKFIEA